MWSPPGQGMEARARGGRAATRASVLRMESADKLARIMSARRTEEDAMGKGLLTPEARLRDLERRIERLQARLAEMDMADGEMTPMKREQQRAMEDDFERLWRQYVGILKDMNG